jgi:hypothetical protein
MTRKKYFYYAKEFLLANYHLNAVYSTTHTNKEGARCFAMFDVSKTVEYLMLFRTE